MAEVEQLRERVKNLEETVAEMLKQQAQFSFRVGQEIGSLYKIHRELKDIVAGSLMP
jgi:tetrahydromethanopterin S-methyltransferase subunit G